MAELIKRNFSMVLQQEGRYIYDDALVTVTNVKMSSDLGLAKVYLSVYNIDDKQSVIIQLEENLAKLRQSLGVRVRKQIRKVPEIHIYLDDTLDEMYRLNALFDKLHDENQMGKSEDNESEK